MTLWTKPSGSDYFQGMTTTSSLCVLLMAKSYPSLRLLLQRLKIQDFMFHLPMFSLPEQPLFLGRALFDLMFSFKRSYLKKNKTTDSSNTGTRFQHVKFYEIFMAQKLHFPIFLSFDSPYVQERGEMCYEERSQRCPHAGFIDLSSKVRGKSWLVLRA